MNTLLFIFHSIFIGMSLVAACYYKKELLISLICIMAILSNLFVVKQITLFGFDVTCTDVFSVGISLGINLIVEVFGQELAKKTIIISFVCLVFYLVMSMFHIAYIPNNHDIASPAFCTILSFAPRIVLASIFSYIVSQYFEYRFFSFLKKFFNNRYFLFRNYITVFLSQLIDTILFSTLGMYKIVANLTHLIILSYTIKVVMILFATPIMSLTKIFITQKAIYEKK